MPEIDNPVGTVIATLVTVPTVGVVQVGVFPVPADVKTCPLVPWLPSKDVVPVSSRLTVCKVLPKKPSRQFLPLLPMSLALFVFGSKSDVIRLKISSVSVFDEPIVALLFTTRLSIVKAFTPVMLPVSSTITTLFWINLPVVVSKRTSALSVALDGPTTSPEPAPPPTCTTLSVPSSFLRYNLPS